MKNQKGFLPIIIILVVLVGFVGIYYLGTLKSKTVTTNPTLTPAPTSKSATPNPTANWKTYVNTSSNYQLKYPSNWKVVNDGLMEAKPADVDTKIVRFSYQPDVSKNEIGVGIEEVVVVNISQGIKFDETKNIGSELAKCGTTNDLMTTFCQLSVSSRSKSLIFTISNYQNLEDNKIIDQILSTFKFTN